MPPRRSKKPGQASEKAKANTNKKASTDTASANKENIPNLASALPLDALTLTTAEASSSAAPSTKGGGAKPSTHEEIRDFVDLLTQLNASSLPLSAEQVDEIGRRLLVLSNTESPEISDDDRSKCEAVLSLLGSLLEKDVEAGSQREPSASASPPLASSKAFCEAVVHLTSQFFHAQRDVLLFCSHYCFELSLYIVLSIVEKSAITAMFVGNLEKSDLVEFLRSLATMLPRDVFYLTQEMATEAICRIAFFLTTHDKATLETAAQLFPERIRSIIMGGKAAVLKLLREMRPFLTEINKDNPHIASFPLKSLNGQEFVDRKNEGAIWLDLCESFLCVYIGEHDVFVRLKYEDVSSSSLKRGRGELIVNLTKGSLPKRFIDVVPVIEQANFDRLDVLFNSPMDAEKAHTFLRTRISHGDNESKSLLSFEPLIEFEPEPIPTATKKTSEGVQRYSVASTKMMQPWMQPAAAAPPPPPRPMEDIEEEISVPPHIPAIVRAVSEGESISELSEDHEEYSFDRQQVRESKRKSITKVDSLVALIAELEKPTKKETAKKKEEQPAPETSVEFPSAFEEPSWAEEPEEPFASTPPRPPSPLKGKTPKTTSSRKIFFGTTKERSEEKKKSAEKSAKAAIRRVEPGMRIEPVGRKEDSWAGDVEPDTSLSSRGSSFAAKRVFGRKTSPTTTEPSSSRMKETTAALAKPKEQREEWEEDMSVEVVQPQKRQESVKKHKPSMTLKTFAPRSAEKPASTDSEESALKKTSPTRRFGKQATTPSLAGRLSEKKEKDEDWEKLVAPEKAKKETVTVAQRKRGPGRPKKIDTKSDKKKKLDERRAGKEKKTKEEEQEEMPEHWEETGMEMPEMEAESFVTPPDAEKTTTTKKETAQKKHTPSPPPAKATPRMTSRSIAPSAFSVESKLKAKAKETAELREESEEKEVEQAQLRERTPRRALLAKTTERAVEVEEGTITEAKRRSPVSLTKEKRKEEAKEEPFGTKEEEEVEISFAEEIAGLDRIMLAQEEEVHEAEEEVQHKEAVKEVATSARKRRGSEISRAAVTEEEEESTLEESSAPPAKMRTRVTATTTTREKTVAHQHQAGRRKTGRDESSWESVAQVSASSVKRRKTAVEEKENIPLQKKPLKTLYEEEEAEEEEEVEEEPMLGTMYRADVYPEEESFESFAHVSKKSGSTAYGESTTDEDSVYTMLVNEIVALNQQRSMRRKARQINALQENVTAQLFAYISNSFNALGSATADIDRETLAQLDALLASIEEVSGTVEDYERSIVGREEKLAKATESLMSEFVELESAMKQYVQERDSETKKLQADISRRRRATVESCSQAINSLTHTVKAPKIGKGMLHML